MRIDLKFYNLDIDQKAIEKKALQFSLDPVPDFVSYQEDFDNLKKILDPCLKYENLIIIGNGGSINSFLSFEGMLGTNKKVFVLDTVEPDVLNNLIRLYPKTNTLIMSISKSGETISVIENTLYFVNLGYQGIAITNKNQGSLSQIAKKLFWPIIHHPEISGRYTGHTSSGFAPAYFAGLPIEKINQGVIDFFNSSAIKTSKPDLALILSLLLFQAEKQGFIEIFLSVYSNFLGAFIRLIDQLFHESFAKDDKGMSVIAGIGPETQHHSIQRYFGGPKNMVGLFTILEKQNQDLKINISNNLKDISYKNKTLDIFNNLFLSRSLFLEAQGTIQDSINSHLPTIVMSIKDRNPETVGELLAFFQLVAYYSSKLRGVDPFNQPEVEESKNITFEQIIKEGYEHNKRY